LPPTAQSHEVRRLLQRHQRRAALVERGAAGAGHLLGHVQLLGERLQLEGQRRQRRIQVVRQPGRDRRHQAEPLEALPKLAIVSVARRPLLLSQILGHIFL